MKILLLVLAFFIFGALPAFGAKRRTVATRRVATQRFSGLKLKGQLKKPDLSYIYKRKGLRADQVVEVPNDFNAEIVESALAF